LISWPKFRIFLRIALKRLLNITFFLLLCPLLTLAQYYTTGFVRDEWGSPLQNAIVFVHSNSASFYSGSDGSFGVITSKLTDTLTFSLEGFQKQKIVVNAGTMLDVRLRKNSSAMSTSANKLLSLTLNLKRETQQQWLTGEETYASTVENHFINTTAYPATGLSLNVDRASYSNIRRFLFMNAMVPEDAVRIEEMVNYFNFNYFEPADKKTFDIKATLTECPWNKRHQLLFAQLTSRKIVLDSLPPTHLVFLIDVSASMDKPERLPLLKSGFKSLVSNLREQDSVSIVVYGGTVGIALETTGGAEKEKILKRIDSLQPGGSTPGESGIKLAYSVARNHFLDSGVNRIILATDGDFNVGVSTDEELDQMITAQKKHGIYLTCLGIGMGNYKDSKIQTLAQRGNGNFAYIDSYIEAEKILMKEFAQTLYTVADDVFLNIRFDPDFVKEYRLIGYDNKVGAIKDKESLIEGGEIGSAYSTMIAIEIIPTQQGILFAKAKESCDCQPIYFDLTYKLPGADSTIEVKEVPRVGFTPFNKMPACHQFASSVIMFGSLLRKSKFIKDITWNDVLHIAENSADMDNYSQKEFVQMVQQAKNIYGKKRKKE